LSTEFVESDQGKAMLKRMPQRRLGIPGELSGALLLLASDASTYMTGSVVVVDGGLSLALVYAAEYRVFVAVCTVRHPAHFIR
jgi:NAD(P)-dependent dehydrogenase (short-subunit alcohol dehydrogenase family)